MNHSLKGINVKREELKKFGLQRIKSWELKKGEIEDGGREMPSIELPVSEELIKLKVQETLSTLLGAKVWIRENDVRLLSIKQELQSQFEKSGKSRFSEAELMDYVRQYFRIRKA